MVAPTPHPLSIADLLTGTAVVALGLAICRATGWNMLYLAALFVYCQFAFHATVLLRGWPIRHGMVEAILISLYWLPLWLVFASAALLTAILPPICIIAEMAAFLASLVLMHRTMRLRHRQYVLKHPAPDRSLDERRTSPFDS